MTTAKEVKRFWITEGIRKAPYGDLGSKKKPPAPVYCGSRTCHDISAKTVQDAQMACELLGILSYEIREGVDSWNDNIVYTTPDIPAYVKAREEERKQRDVDGAAKVGRINALQKEWKLSLSPQGKIKRIEERPWEGGRSYRREVNGSAKVLIRLKDFKEGETADGRTEKWNDVYIGQYRTKIGGFKFKKFRADFRFAFPNVDDATINLWLKSAAASYDGVLALLKKT